MKLAYFGLGVIVGAVVFEPLQLAWWQSWSIAVGLAMAGSSADNYHQGCDADRGKHFGRIAFSAVVASLAFAWAREMYEDSLQVSAASAVAGILGRRAVHLLGKAKLAVILGRVASMIGNENDDPGNGEKRG